MEPGMEARVVGREESFSGREDEMAENANNENALYLILGGVIVVIVLGFLYFNGYLGGRGEQPDININVPSPTQPVIPSAPAIPAPE